MSPSLSAALIIERLLFHTSPGRQKNLLTRPSRRRVETSQGQGSHFCPAFGVRGKLNVPVEDEPDRLTSWCTTVPSLRSTH